MKHFICFLMFCLSCLSFGAPAMDNASGNLIKDGSFTGLEISKNWKHGGLIHDPSDMKKFYNEISSMLIRQIDKTQFYSSPASLKIDSSPEIRTVRNDKGAAMSISSYIEQFVDVMPGKYEFSMALRGTKPSTGFNAVRVFVHFQGKNFYKPNAVTFMPGLKNDWTVFKGSFEVPENVKKIGIRITYYGCGELNYDDISLRKAAAGE